MFLVLSFKVGVVYGIFPCADDVVGCVENFTKKSETQAQVIKSHENWMDFTQTEAYLNLNKQTNFDYHQAFNAWLTRQFNPLQVSQSFFLKNAKALYKTTTETEADLKPYVQILAALSTNKKDFEEGNQPRAKHMEKSFDRAKCWMIIEDLLFMERQFKDWFVFYHAYKGEDAEVAKHISEPLVSLAVAYDFYKTIYSWLYLKPAINNIILRFGDDRFQTHETFENFLNEKMFFSTGGALKSGQPDKNKTFKECAISVGISTLSGSFYQAAECVFTDFFIENSMPLPGTKRRIKSFLDKFKIQEVDQIVMNLIENYNDNFPKNSGNHLLQIFVNPDIVNSIAYPCIHFGIPINDDVFTPASNSSMGEVIKQFRLNAKNYKLPATLDADDFTEFDSEKSYDLLQARLYLPPKIFVDEGKVKIFRYYSKKTRNEVEANLATYYSGLDRICKNFIKQFIDTQLAVNAPEINDEFVKNLPLYELIEKIKTNHNEFGMLKIRSKVYAARVKIFDTKNKISDIKKDLERLKS